MSARLEPSPSGILGGPQASKKASSAGSGAEYRAPGLRLVRSGHHVPILFGLVGETAPLEHEVLLWRPSTCDDVTGRHPLTSTGPQPQCWHFQPQGPQAAGWTSRPPRRVLLGPSPRDHPSSLAHLCQTSHSLRAPLRPRVDLCCVCRKGWRHIPEPGCTSKTTGEGLWRQTQEVPLLLVIILLSYKNLDVY